MKYINHFIFKENNKINLIFKKSNFFLVNKKSNNYDIGKFILLKLF